MFTEILVHISRRLSLRGFKRSGSKFSGVWDHGFTIIDFQKSMRSTKTDVRFTINAGIGVSYIIEFLDPENKLKTFDNCQWKKRAGNFLGNDDDYWWIVNSGSDPIRIRAEVADMIDKLILPDLAHNQNIDRLMSLFASQSSPGLTEIENDLYYLIILKHNRKDSREFNKIALDTIAKYKAPESQSLIQYYVKKLL